MKELLSIFVLSLLICSIQNTQAQIFDMIKKETEKAIIKETQKLPEVKEEQQKTNEVNTNDGKQDSTKDIKNNGVNDTGTKETETNTQFLSSSKYDFVPGEKIILFDDFSQDAVGDFPALWTANAPGEINTLSIAPGNWFNLNSGDGNYFYLKNVEFPKNFIIEFDIVPKKTGGRIADFIIWVQNRRVRIYHKQAKVLDMPTNIYEGTNFNRFCFRLSRGASSGSYISNFRITDASPDMRSKLLTDGKLVSYEICFDVNNDVVKSESYGTIKEIATVLMENPAVKIKL